MRSVLPLLILAFVLPACESPVPLGTGSDDDEEPRPRLDHCQLTTDDLMVGAEWDAIRAIDDPRFVPADELPIDRISPDERVIGLRIDGESLAIPHGEIWAHEVLNLDRSVDLAVTYCPLTGSALAFDRAPVGGVRMGVSGFLLHENLVLFDRNDRPVLWAQMSASSLCGGVPRAERLPQWPVIEVRWETWRALHPNTLVLDARDEASSAADPSSPTSGTRSTSPWHAPAASFDRSERVIGAPSSRTDPGIAFSFRGLVERTGDRQVISFEHDGESYRLLWSDRAMGGMAYFPRTESGQHVNLAPEEGTGPEEGGFRDRNTGSLFTLDGRGVSGPLAGEALVPLVEAYVAYRGPWLDFHPDSRMWGE
ncbi:MAG: DUF3179 domain-containing (seleno)protein [Longimicrobiales bacterium]|nr:DUF3179 domain-containing (seleno)protein [Longimicrobiales bacterium]